MRKPSQYYLTSVLFLLVYIGIFPELVRAAPAYQNTIQEDPSDKYFLLNGRVWRNQYSSAFGDPFFLSKEFIKGSVTYNGRTFNNLNLKYDIKNDELLLSIESYPIIYMNKEMVDSFSLVFDRLYKIINIGNDSSDGLNGYVNVLYNGPTALYVKYVKKIQQQAVDGRYDQFSQEHHIYLRRGEDLLSVRGVRMLLNILEDKKKEIRYFIKINKHKLKKNDPFTFIPLLEYYDSLSR